MRKGTARRPLDPAFLWHCTCRLLPICAGLLVLPDARSQSSSNTDFELSGGYALASDAHWLSWSVVAPGWQHAPGANTIFVTRGVQISTTTQSYFLVDSASSPWSPLAGNFSLGLASGHYSSTEPNSPWVPAYIEEAVVVPEDARSFQMLAVGDVSLSLDSQKVPLTNLGGDSYAADISAFAGQPVTVRIENDSTALLDPVIVDNIGFSPTAVPEPTTAQFLAGGFIVLILALRHRRNAGA
jgi:hypothetical protein